MKVRISQSPHHTQIRFVTREDRFEIIDFEAEAMEIAVRYEADQPVIWCGLGEEGCCTPHILRSAAAWGVQKSAELKRTSASAIIPPLACCNGSEAALVLEGALLGAYRFDKYKSDKKPRLQTLELVGAAVARSEITRVEAICSAVNFARDLVNENAGEITPARLASEAGRITKGAGMRLTVLDEKAITREKMGLFSAVGKGSPYPPRLIVMEYCGDPRSKRSTAVVGKGITFDSGGQNLKPSGSIETMRQDMAGAAAVLGLFKALALAKPRVNVVGVIAAAHNAIDGNSYFPGDIYTARLGKTVEITNTDAEGRLVLADAITYCIDKTRPDRIVDLATLTGGILSALGEFVAGLFSNNDQLAGDLFSAGERTRERLWRFPLYKEYSDAMKGDLADLRNTAKFKKGYAGSITGAAFIQEFVGTTPWAHLDIAGVAYNESEPRAETPRNATGFGVRLLFDFLTHT